MAQESTREISAELLVLDHSGTRVVLDKLDLDQTKARLGVKLCPTGCMAQQVVTMMAKAQILANEMRTGRLKRPEVWLALNSPIWKILEYPLNLLTMTKTECECTQS